MVSPRALGASKMQLTMCRRASFVWAGREVQWWVPQGLCLCDEKTKVEQTAICLETDIDAIWQVLFCLTEHSAEENGKQSWGRDAPLLDANGDGGVAWQWPVVLHLTFTELADIPQSIAASSMKGLACLRKLHADPFLFCAVICGKCSVLIWHHE